MASRRPGVPLDAATVPGNELEVFTSAQTACGAFLHHQTVDGDLREPWPKRRLRAFRDTQHTTVTFPLVADPDGRVAKRQGSEMFRRHGVRPLAAAMARVGVQ